MTTRNEERERERANRLPSLEELRQAIADREAEIVAVSAVIDGARGEVEALGSAFDKAIASLQEALAMRTEAEAAYVADPTPQREQAIVESDSRMRARNLIVDASGAKHAQALDALRVAESGLVKGREQIAALERQIVAHPHTIHAAAAPIVRELVAHAVALRTLTAQLDRIGHEAHVAGGNSPPDPWHVLLPLLEVTHASGIVLEDSELMKLRYLPRHTDPAGNHPGRGTDVAELLTIIGEIMSKPQASPTALKFFAALTEEMRASRTFAILLHQRHVASHPSLRSDEAPHPASPSRPLPRPIAGDGIPTTYLSAGDPAAIDHAIARAFPSLAAGDDARPFNTGDARGPGQRLA